MIMRVGSGVFSFLAESPLAVVDQTAVELHQTRCHLRLALLVLRRMRLFVASAVLASSAAAELKFRARFSINSPVIDEGIAI